VSVRVEAGDGLGGLCVRFDEWHHYEIEVGAGKVTARAVVAGIRQEWSCSAPANVVTLHLECVSPSGNSLLDFLTCDVVVLSVGGSDESEKIEVARVDGRYLSQETAASFTGRVIGLYAVSGRAGTAGDRRVGSARRQAASALRRSAGC
jgi:xylan 1,4-beta-xylosidase